MWQDLYFTVSGLFYSLVLIPSMLDRKTEVSRKSSVPTAIILGVSAIVWMTMGMHASAAMSAFAVLPWAFLAWRRPIRSSVGERDGEVTVNMDITEEEFLSMRKQETGWRMLLTDEREIEMVEKYREWQAKHIHPAGCGTCPSPCSEAEADVSDPSL